MGYLKASIALPATAEQTFSSRDYISFWKYEIKVQQKISVPAKMFTVMHCYNPKLLVSYELGTTVFLTGLVSIHSFCWHLLWVDDGIRSVPLGEKKGYPTLRASQTAGNLWESQKVEMGFAFFALTTVVILLIQGLKASEDFENLCMHRMERWDYRREKYFWNLLCFNQRMWLLK